MTPGEQRYLVAHDYGMGGVWRYVLARSSDEIRRRFPELVVVDEEPDWMTDELRGRLEALVERLEDPPPRGLLATVLAERTGSN
jgi:hypothetical protein